MIARVTAVAARRGPRVPPRPGRAGRTPPTPTACSGGRCATAGAATQATLNERLMAAYFTDGDDVGDPDVLVDRAADCGLDADAVARRPRRRGRASRRSPSPCARRRPRHHRRADVRHRLAVEHPRRPGPRRTSSSVLRRVACIDDARRPTGSPRRRIGRRGAASSSSTASPRPARRGRRSPRRSTPTATRWSPSTRPVTARRRTLRVDLAAGADAARPTPAERATYVGYSMGGRLALHLAVARPDLVERLVLVSSTAGIDDDDRASRPAGRRRAPRDARSSATASPRSSTDWLALPLFANLPPDAAQLADRLGEHRRRAWRRACASPAPAPSSRCGRSLPSLTMPVLLVAGAARRQVRRDRRADGGADPPTPPSPSSPAPDTSSTSSDPTRSSPPCAAGSTPPGRRRIGMPVELSRRAPARASSARRRRAAGGRSRRARRSAPDRCAPPRTRRTGATANGDGGEAEQRRRPPRPRRRRRRATNVAATRATYSHLVRCVAEAHGQRALAGHRVGRDVAQVVDDEQGAGDEPGGAPDHDAQPGDPSRR